MRYTSVKDSLANAKGPSAQRTRLTVHRLSFQLDCSDAREGWLEGRCVKRDVKLQTVQQSASRPADLIKPQQGMLTSDALTFYRFVYTTLVVAVDTLFVTRRSVLTACQPGPGRESRRETLTGLIDRMTGIMRRFKLGGNLHLTVSLRVSKLSCCLISRRRSTRQVYNMVSFAAESSREVGGGHRNGSEPLAFDFGEAVWLTTTV